MMRDKSNKKPLYRRFWVWALALVVVGGIAIGSGSDTPAEDAGDGESGDAGPEAAAETPPTVGEAVMVGEIEWRLANAEVTEFFGDDVFSVEPSSDRTLLVAVEGELTNTSQEELSTLGDLQLVDADGTEYGEHEDAALAGESLTLDSLNPNVPKTFSTVFEVPKDVVEGIRFRATDLAMFGPEEVMIDLGLAAE
jgi:hypothetical protein